VQRRFGGRRRRQDRAASGPAIFEKERVGDATDGARIAAPETAITQKIQTKKLHRRRCAVGCQWVSAV
jgi:hypothetical protein